MSDLRESGTIEADADMVALLWRSVFYVDSDEAREAEVGKAILILAKNSRGATGHVPLVFIADLMRFETNTRD